MLPNISNIILRTFTQVSNKTEALNKPLNISFGPGLTQPLTEMSTRNIYWGGKGAWCLGLTTLPPSCADCLEIWEPQPLGILRACSAM
jgi:hypothetical protein